MSASGQEHLVETLSAAEGYPRLLRRLQGVFIDGVVIPIAAVGSLVALSYAGVESLWIKVGCPLAVIFLLDPVAVSATGGSVGHHVMGLRVRKAGKDERIGLLAAFVRLLVKTFFGIPAFFVAFITRKRQALHDLVAQSLIVHKSLAGLPRYELLPERTRSDEHAAYVSIWRRVLVVLLYWVLSYLALNVVAVAVLRGPCIGRGECSETQALFAIGALAGWFILLIVFAVLGWRGKLFGCRRASITKDCP